jgi:hypothetical protein
LGGTPAQAGYDAGDLTHFFALPGSLTAGVLDLANTSNVSISTPGLWTMAIRDGQTSSGTSVTAPLLPTIVDPSTGAYDFNFNIVFDDQGQPLPTYIDPVVEVGYTYHVTSGQHIQTALFPTVAGDTNGYSVYSIEGDLLGTAMPGNAFNFGTGAHYSVGV